MAQLERPLSQRQVNTSKTSPTPTIHTMEQLLRVGEVSKSKRSPTFSSSSSTNSSSPSSPFFQRLRHHDSEEDHGQNQKKSVLTKVKEKAKKLRHSLSKRKHEDCNVISPSSATGVVDGDGAEEDAEYFGAPMYESEKAPAGYKANEKQHPSPRGNPRSPEKHVISSSDKHVVEQNQEKSLNRSISKKTTTESATTITTPNATAAAAAAATATTITPSSPNKPISETITQKLTPIRVEASDSAPSITSKLEGLTLSKPREHHDHTSSSTVKTTGNTSLSYAAPRTLPTKVTSQASSSSPRAPSSTPAIPAPSPAPVSPTPSSAPSLSGKNTSPTAQIWDKGILMKEYLMNKLEPGEDEKALSQVISEAMSPRRTPGDAGVIEKVREAVTSLLRTEEPTKYADTITTPTSTTSRASSPMSPFTNASRATSQLPASANTSPSQIPTVTNASRASSSQMPVSINASRASPSQIPTVTNASRASSQMPASTNIARASSQIPVSYNAQEEYAVAEEENHGRILQAN